MYPRLLYELVRLAAAEGCAFVDLGLTSADPKLRAGAQPVPLRVWARHRNPLVQKLLRAAIPRLAGAAARPRAKRVPRAAGGAAAGLVRRGRPISLVSPERIVVR